MLDLPRVPPGEFLHILHGQLLPVFQPPDDQKFLDPADRKQRQLHLGTDHIVIDGSAEICIDKEHQKLFAQIFPLFFMAAQRPIHPVKFLTDLKIFLFASLIQPPFRPVKHLIPLRAQTFQAIKHLKFFLLPLPLMKRCRIHALF